jgi:quercetin dioxygenase-like cupin family protein
MKSKMPALCVTLDAIKRDRALQPGNRGDRKILVTTIYELTERAAMDVNWKPPASPSDKCPVQEMENVEIAVFNQRASRDCHKHKKGTEIYMVLEGRMIIEVEGKDYALETGDMIVVNPGAVHQVKAEGTEFICRVVTTNCGGASDKYPV